MRIPIIVYAAAAAQALPPLAALRYRRLLPPARWWIVCWVSILLVYDGVSLWTALHGIANLWTGYFVAPLEVATLLMALSYWQESHVARLAFRCAIPVFVLISVALVILVEDTTTWSLVTGPLQGLLLLAASLTTLLIRIRNQEGDLGRQDWFWICIGLALKYGASPMVDPLARLLAPTDPAIVVTAFKVKSLVDIIACIVIAGGILCPVPLRRPSSGPSSPALSPSPLSSSPSGPRS